MGTPKEVENTKYTIEVAEWTDAEYEEGKPHGTVVCRICGKVAVYNERANEAEEAARAHMTIHEDPIQYDVKELRAAFRWEQAYSVADLEQ